MNWQANITTNPEVLYGRPIIKGTRIPIDLLLEELSTGETFEGLMAAYPTLKHVDLLEVEKMVTEGVWIK